MKVKEVIEEIKRIEEVIVNTESRDVALSLEKTKVRLEEKEIKEE